MPLLAHRVRKAATRRGTRVALLNPADFPYLFPVAARVVSSPALMLADLLGVLGAAAEAAKASVPAHLARAASVRGRRPGAPRSRRGTDERARSARSGSVRSRSAIRPGPTCAPSRSRSPTCTGATLGVLAEGGNAAGAWLAGAVPHREAGGQGATAARAGRRAE